jgi:hypothetical protein
VTAEKTSKLLTLKRKIGYDEINDEADRRLAGKQSFQTMDDARGVESAENLSGIRSVEVRTDPELAENLNLKRSIENMELD